MTQLHVNGRNSDSFVFPPRSCARGLKDVFALGGPSEVGCALSKVEYATFVAANRQDCQLSEKALQILAAHDQVVMRSETKIVSNALHLKSRKSLSQRAPDHPAVVVDVEDCLNSWAEKLLLVACFFRLPEINSAPISK